MGRELSCGGVFSTAGCAVRACVQCGGGGGAELAAPCVQWGDLVTGCCIGGEGGDIS